MTKVLLFDIETAPIIGTIWQKWEANMIWSVQDWYMLCFAYKWLGERHTRVISQDDFKSYKAGSDDDKAVVGALHALFDQADVLVAHNGNSFDIKKSNARFIYHGMRPPAPYEKIDTKLMAKRYFNFTSNKLDDLGEHLGLGRKLRTDKELWRGCMAGDTKAWKYMKAYNKQDVILLEKVYLKMMPYSSVHPNMANIAGRPGTCPKCESDTGMLAQGWRLTKTARYRRWQCKSCGSYVSERKAEKGTSPIYV